MENFEFYSPTKVIFGKGVQKKAGRLVKEYGGKRVLVLFGGKSAKASGLLKEVEDSLREEQLDYVELGGVVPNPLLSKVREAISLCRDLNLDFILAVGGGSVIDSAKAIAYGLASDKDVWDFYSGKAEAEDAFPVGAVPTLSAAGSETSDASVITNDDGMLKRGYCSDYGHCKFALLNPDLTSTLPFYQTASGCVDIIMHTLERYFSGQRDARLQDSIAEALIRTVIGSAEILRDHPEDYSARADVMWASELSHNGVTGSRFAGDWACHQLEHELGGMFDVAHGAGLAAVWGTWARYVMDVNPARFARLGRNVFNIVSSDDRDAAIKCVAAMESFFKSIGMPTRIPDMGVNPTAEEIEELAYKCSFGGERKIGAFKRLDRSDMKKIYELASK